MANNIVMLNVINLDASTAAPIMVGGGGMKVASSIEEAEAMDIKDGEFVNIYTPETSFEGSLADAGMVEYDEENFKILNINNAKPIREIRHSDYGYNTCWFVNAVDPTTTYKISWNEEYQDNTMTVYHEGRFVAEEGFELLDTQGAYLYKYEDFTAERYDEFVATYKLAEQNANGGLFLICSGGIKQSLTEMVKLGGTLCERVVKAEPLFIISNSEKFSYGSGEIDCHSTTKLSQCQYIWLTGVTAPVPLTENDNGTLTAIYTILEEDGGNCLSIISRVRLTIQSKSSENGVFAVDWMAHTFNFIDLT